MDLTHSSSLGGVRLGLFRAVRRPQSGGLGGAAQTMALLRPQLSEGEDLRHHHCRLLVYTAPGVLGFVICAMGILARSLSRLEGPAGMSDVEMLCKTLALACHGVGRSTRTRNHRSCQVPGLPWVLPVFHAAGPH